MPELVKNYSNGSAIKIAYSVSQNVSKNQSTVTMTLYVHRDSYGPSWNTHCNSYIQLDGANVMTYTGSFHIGTSWVKIGSTVSKTVTHNSDGTKTIALKGFFDSQGLTAKLDDLTVTGNVTLQTIPRASKVSGVSGSTIGSPITVSISREVSGFTHKVYYSFGSVKDRLLGSNVGTSLTFTPPMEDCGQVPDSASGTATIRVDTYNGSTKIGSSSKNITLMVPSSVVPTMTGISFTPINGQVPAEWGIYVQTKSKVTAQITGAAGAYGSTIKSYSISGGGYSGTSSSLTTGFLNKAGSISFTAKITDSRGRTASKTASISVEEYAPPVLSSAKAFRCNEQGEEQDDGAYLSLTLQFSGHDLGGKNAITGGYRTQAEGGSWSGLSPAENGKTVIFSANPDLTLTVQAQAADTFTEVTKDLTVNSTRFIMDFRAGGNGIAFGKAAEYDDLLDTNWRARFRRGIQMMDANGAFYALVFNGTNLWIGAYRTTDTDKEVAGHHTGKTIISCGVDTETGKGNPYPYACIPDGTSDGENYPILHGGMVKKTLWSGSWSGGTITIAGLSQFREFRILMEGQGTTVSAYLYGDNLRGEGGYSTATSTITYYHFAATVSGDALTFVACNSRRANSTTVSGCVVSSIIGIL